MASTLHFVTDSPELWSGHDPVRPNLGVDFKTAPGRGVFGLKDEEGTWKAFMCFARTTAVPKDVNELEELTDTQGTICIPYTVWSHVKGAGKEIINQVLDFVKAADDGIQRVVTLSPITEMARKFHLRNGAMLLGSNETTINFEYPLE